MFPGVLPLGFPRPAEHMPGGVPPVLKQADLSPLVCGFPKRERKRSRSRFSQPIGTLVSHNNHFSVHSIWKFSRLDSAPQ